jgi:hypothetical protein
METRLPQEPHCLADCYGDRWAEHFRLGVAAQGYNWKGRDWGMRARAAHAVFTTLAGGARLEMEYVLSPELVRAEHVDDDA